MGWAGHVLGGLLLKRSLGRPGSRWDDGAGAGHAQWTEVIWLRTGSGGSVL